MFRIIADDDQVKDNQATQVIWKGTNFIGFGAKLAEEAFQQVGGTDQRMQGMVKLVKGQAGVHILGQQPHDLGLQRPPRRAKLRQTRFGLRTGGRLKDRVRIPGELLPPQPPRGFVGERLLGEGIGRRQIAVAEGALESPNFVDDTALLLGVGQVGRERSGQPRAAIAHDHLDGRGIQATPDQRGQQIRPGCGIFSGGQLIVDDLVAAIFPHPHDGQDHLVLCGGSARCPWAIGPHG